VDSENSFNRGAESSCARLEGFRSFEKIKEYILDESENFAEMVSL
jgi:hypothetical protein